MTVTIDGASIRSIALGVLVTRATSTLPTGGNDLALFTITGGRILLVGLAGEVTTVIQTQANATKPKLTPTATGVDQDLCATLDITADAVGEQYTISGSVGDAMRSDLLIENGKLQEPLILSEGDLELTCAATNSGSVQWDMVYVPWDAGATVAAA